MIFTEKSRFSEPSGQKRTSHLQRPDFVLKSRKIVENMLQHHIIMLQPQKKHLVTIGSSYEEFRENLGKFWWSYTFFFLPRDQNGVILFFPSTSHISPVA